MKALFFILVFLMLLAGEFEEIFHIFACAGTVLLCYFIYTVIRQLVDPVYAARAKKEAEEMERTKRRKRRVSGWPNERQYRNYYRTGDRRYLYRDDFRGN